MTIIYPCAPLGKERMAKTTASMNNIDSFNRRPITVLHLCEHFGGKESSLHGVARAFQWWLPRFDPSRFKIVLCSRKGYDKAAAEMIKKGIHPLYLGYNKLDPRNLLRLIQIVRKEKIDIIRHVGDALGQQ